MQLRSSKLNKQQHIQIRMCTKTNKRTRWLSKINMTMCHIFHRNQYQSRVVSRRHWSAVLYINTAYWCAIAIIVTKQQHIKSRMCTKTNKRTRNCSSKVNITMCRIFHRNQCTSRVMSRLKCCCTFDSTRVCNFIHRNQATTHPNLNVHQNK